MDSGSKKSSFLVQGSILAVASIVSRMIGLVYRVVVTNILGDIGKTTTLVLFPYIPSCLQYHLSAYPWLFPS